MKIIQQLPALKIPNLLIVQEIVQNGLMVTVAGVNSPWAFIRPWEGDTPKWVHGLKYIRAEGTKGAPYRRHILELFKSQRDAWMIGGQGPLEAKFLGYYDCNQDDWEANAVRFTEMNSREALMQYGFHFAAYFKPFNQCTS